jgi:peptide/nickel transport system substrate-binding protein/oligopeptide transport system substrate-binding protein
MNRIFIILGVLAAGILVFAVLSMQGGRRAVEGKVLRLAMEAEPKTLDPIGITDVYSDGVGRKIHNALVRLKNNGGQGMIVEPDVAEKFEVSPDGKVYTFWLRKGVLFHNGREVKAADVAYSLSRLLWPESKRAEWIMPMVAGSADERAKKSPGVPKGIQVIDDHTLKIELGAPFAPFLQHLCTVNCSIVPKEAVEDTRKPFARYPVGVGAFKLAERSDNNLLLLTRNDNYFKGKPKLSAIQYSIMNSTMRLDNYFKGNLDACDLPAGRVKEALQRAGPENVLISTTYRTNYLGIGLPNGNFKDKADLQSFGKNKLLRQALNYAIDRNNLCNTLLEGRGIPAKSILPPNFPAFKEGRPGWPLDIAKAKALLSEAGYPEGKGLPPVNLYCMVEEDVKRIAQAVAADLEKIGVQVNLNPTARNKFYEMLEVEPHQMFMLGWVADYPDPDNFLYVLFHTGQAGAPGNHTWYSNPDVDKLVEKARALADMRERAPLYQQAEDIILDECPWIVTYHVVNQVLLRKEVRGIRENITPLDTGTEFSQVDFAFVDIE